MTTIRLLRPIKLVNGRVLPAGSEWTSTRYEDAIGPRLILSDGSGAVCYGAELGACEEVETA